MHVHEGGGAVGTAILLIPFVLAAVIYTVGVVAERRRGRPWPLLRLAAWLAGVAVAAAGFIGPVAGAAASFSAHAVAHVMAGMLAPLLLVMAAPVTLALRTLHVSRARRLSRVLRSRAARVLTFPVTAAALSVGGMWVLYSTDLVAMSERSIVVHLAVMGHMLLAGYLFTAALISTDPSPHRSGFALRIAVLVVALTAHGVLTKLLYANGLPGVDPPDVQAGAMLMYYAGDVVDAAVALVLCAQWYVAAGRALARSAARMTVSPATG